VGIRLKLSFFIGLGVVVTSLIVGYLALRTGEGFLRQDVETRGIQILRALAIPCAVPLAKHNINELDTYIAGFDEGEGRDLDLIWVAVLDQDGRILSHTDSTRYNERMEDPFTARALAAKGPVSEWDEEARRLRLAMPVAIRGLRFGTLRSEMSLERMDARVYELRMRALGWAIVGAILAVGQLALLLSRVILGPVRTLSDAASQLGSGDLRARTNLRGGRKDELAVLGQVFDQMAASLEAHTSELEGKVADRTRELKEANARLELLATTDELTGLFNHRYFQESLKLEVLRRERKASPLSLLMIDVDHFKRFNDTHGHPAGDKILRGVAQRLKDSLRHVDIVARYGGEEFAVILLDTTKEAAAQVGEKLRAAVAEAGFPGAETQPMGHVSVSIGLATLPEDANNAADLVSVADAALYRAKHGGRNRVAVAGQ
jgi:diguanylate cyclase (GGDEF)-like protein